MLLDVIDIEDTDDHYNTTDHLHSTTSDIHRTTGDVFSGADGFGVFYEAYGFADGTRDPDGGATSNI